MSNKKSVLTKLPKKVGRIFTLIKRNINKTKEVR